MARIDDLLSQAADESLREEIRRAVGDLRRRKKFGLVFEEHIPEITLLAMAGVWEGSTVLLRREPSDQTRYTVEAVQNGVATIRANGSDPIEVAVSDLLVVKSFGEPVYPVLTPLETLTRSPGRPYHVVINGENFHALQVALFGLEGQIDLIYIDPPYNTGARDWKYNNRYVDATDTWRHSKWLSFMQKRLLLAKQLLKSNGVLIVTIDANEVHHLGLLLEDIFPEARRQMVTISINASGASGEGLSRVEEYAFFCFLGDSHPVPISDDLLTPEATQNDPYSVQWESLLRRGNVWYRNKRRNLCYPILIDTSSNRIVGVGEPLEGEDDEARPQTKDGYPLAWPVRTDGRLGIWRVDGARLMSTVRGIESGEIEVIGRGAQRQVLLRPHKARRTIAKTIWHRGRHTAGAAGGTQLLSALLGERDVFPFPKSLYAVRDCIEIAVGDRPDAKIVDFFAGSGTTLHATALLNAEDGGRRQCLLVTNNEVEEKETAALNKRAFFRGDQEFETAGIFERATRPRVKAALTGRHPDGEPVVGDYLNGRPYSEGFLENAAFFRLDYADPDTLALGYAFAAIVPALWLAAGRTGDPAALGDPEPGMFLPPGAPFAVLLNEDALRAFLVRLEERPDITHVWLVTDSEGGFARMREQVPGDRMVGMLYRDYLRNFRINVEVDR